MAEVTLNMRGKRIVSREYEWHTVTSETIPADPLIAAQVQEERSEFVAGADFQPHDNPINQTVLERPIDLLQPLPPYLYGNPEIQPLQRVPVGNI